MPQLDGRQQSVYGVSYGNASGDYSASTDYEIFSSSGIIQLLPSAAANDNNINDTFASYTYCPDDYLVLPWGRSIMNLVAGFFALAILGLGLGLFYSVAKDAGILGN